MKFTIGRRIIVTCVSIILIFVSMNLFLQYHNKAASTQYKALSDNAALLTVTAKDIQTELWKKNTYVRNYMLTGNPQYITDCDNSQNIINEKIEFLEQKMTSPGDHKEIGVLKLAMNEYNSVLTQSMRVRDKLGMEGILKFLAASGQRAGYIGKIVDDFVQYIDQNAKAKIAQEESAEARIAFITILFSGILFLIALGSSMWLARQISKPLTFMAQTANEIAKGNLKLHNLQYVRNDEIGEMVKAFQNMLGGLRKLIEEVSATVNHVFTSSEQLNNVADQSAQASGQVAETTVKVAESATLQTKEIDQVHTAVQDMVSANKRIGDSAAEVSEKSSETANAAAEGGKAVAKAQDQMQLITDSVSQSAEVVQELNESSKQIGEIVEVISGIAGQTNLLALNAAIEAARAGEQGRGFAVVADEVRKLAEESQKAAQRITGIIQQIQSKTDMAVSLMKRGHHDVLDGSQVMAETGKQFQHIVYLVNGLTEAIKEINTDIEKNAAFSSQVLQSVNKVREMAVHTATSTETISAASEEQLASMEEVATSSRLLSDKAEHLQQITGRFSL